MPSYDIPLERTHPFRHELSRVILTGIGARGAGCTVAVIDTGIDPDYFTERAFLDARPNVIAHDFTRGQEGWKETGTPHGSRIIADILESAPSVAMHSLRVHGATALADREDVVSALQWCGRNRVQVANLSLNFYKGCSAAEPCILCRAVNSVALASGMFIVISSGDAITVGEAIDAGQAPHLCPLSNGQMAWGIASPEVVTAARVLLRSPEGGLSFTTGKFTAGIAQLRGILPGVDLFELRYCLRRTCVPTPHVAPAVGGFGRHSFLLAWLAASGLAEPPSDLDLASLSRPSPAQPGQLVDGALLRAMRLLASRMILPQRWDAAGAMLDRVIATVEPWAGPVDRMLGRYMRGCCREALGADIAAGEDYGAVEALVDAWASATEAGAAQ